jgi:uncharacterized protein (UPF0210 family)
MKIRTITTGFNLKIPVSEKQVRRIAEVTLRLRRGFEQEGYEVQTVRIATQPWERYYSSHEQILRLVKKLESLASDHGIDYFSIGTTTSPQHIPEIFHLIRNSERGFCSVLVSDERRTFFESARQAARLVRKLSRVNEDGFANLRFAALFNMKPGSPFFPAAYHRGPTSFALGTENSDLVYKAFSTSKDFETAGDILKTEFTNHYQRLEMVACRMGREERIRYGGVDVSVAPSVKRQQSAAFAFEKLGLGRFGEAGTLAVAKMVTDTFQNLKLKKCGYSGLMLPVLEDFGLARRNDERTFNLTNLLLYSAVCGTGLDTIPLAGNIPEKKLYALFLDIAALSLKLNKPLSARMMPIPGRKAGDTTKFSFPYFVNSRIMDL